MKKKSVIEAIHEAQNWFFKKEIDKPWVTSVIGKRVKVWVKVQIANTRNKKWCVETDPLNIK